MKNVNSSGGSCGRLFTIGKTEIFATDGNLPLGIAEYFKDNAVSSVFVLSESSDYVLVGKKICETLAARSVKTVRSTFDDGDDPSFSLPLLYGGEQAITVVGDGDALLAAANFAAGKGIKLIYAPTTCLLSDALSGKTAPDAVFFDEKIAGTKKHSLAAAYGKATAESLAIIDYKTAVLTGNATLDKKYFLLACQAVNAALGVNSSENKPLSLAKSQLMLADVYANSDVLSFGGQKAVAENLFRIRKAEKAELEFFAFSRLVKLYSEYFMAEKLPVLSPDLLGSVLDFCHFSDGEEYETINSSVGKAAFDGMTDRIKNAAKVPLKRELDALTKAMPAFISTYSGLYGGKTKPSFTADELRSAVSAACFSSRAGVLAMMREDGFTQLFAV